jgi:hypothetical protein
VSISHGTPSVASQNTPIQQITPRVLPEAEIDDNSDQEHLINNETDHCKTDKEGNDDNDEVDPCAPLQPNVLLEDVIEQQRATVEQQKRMIEIVFN